MINTANQKLVMRRAWAEARRGQTIYGGPVRQYIAEALRLAWADLKADPIKKVADAIIAEIRAGKIKRIYAPPYCVRGRGYRAVTSWYAAQ